ncbi:acetyltransferase [Isoptericola sp. NEAU-Y5]|uniref:Acetyltransferase n=1 Tax=Isoptericola luteus TaxID=2879484 RepID=A0ABS7ZDH5_9MICO|nr:GNAT family N-acetyltransferase [Isoptericola sp. NEAU-Y5]MCA5892326.1 acetyltransferase [Isoptericola sp. NEAU-Y5]
MSTLAFRRTRRGDLSQIQAWLRQPHVARYWAHDTSDAAVERDFAGSFGGTEPSEDFVVSDGGVDVGFVQRCCIHDYAAEERELIELVEVPADALTIDYFVGEADRVGQGVGSRMVREFVALCWRDHPGATAIVVPVVVGNVASWSALRSAGFRRVATGHLPPDNPVDDGLHHVYRLDRPAG